MRDTSFELYTEEPYIMLLSHDNPRLMSRASVIQGMFQSLGISSRVPTDQPYDECLINVPSHTLNAHTF
jgi:hypothetical protein